MNMKCNVLQNTIGIVLLIASLSTVSACQQNGTTSSEGLAERAMKSTIAAENRTGEAISGEELYTRNCEVCHSLRPPAKTAPPIAGLASRFRTVYGNKDDAVAAMVSFMKAPDAANTSLGPQAIQRFGLMPAMAMPDEELEKVAGWLWDQYDPNFVPGGGYR